MTQPPRRLKFNSICVVWKIKYSTDQWANKRDQQPEVKWKTRKKQINKIVVNQRTPPPSQSINIVNTIAIFEFGYKYLWKIIVSGDHHQKEEETNKCETSIKSANDVDEAV